MNQDLLEKIANLDDDQVWELFGYMSLFLKERGLVRTRNIVGERGEFLAIKVYNSTPGLPNLQAAPEGTQNVDAISRKGDRYSIKTVTEPGRTTGVFYGMGEPDSVESVNKKFEYATIVVIDRSFNLVKVIELTWEQAFKFKKWHKTMRAWNITLTKEVLQEARLIRNH